MEIGDDFKVCCVATLFNCLREMKSVLNFLVGWSSPFIRSTRCTFYKTYVLCLFSTSHRQCAWLGSRTLLQWMMLCSTSSLQFQPMSTQEPLEAKLLGLTYNTTIGNIASISLYPGKFPRSACPLRTGDAAFITKSTSE